MRSTTSPGRAKPHIGRLHDEKGAKKGKGKKNQFPALENRKSKVDKVDEMARDDHTLDTTTGKLPVEAAYVTMKRVVSETGLPIKPHGKSTYNKLASFPTEPAVDLLSGQTWKEFFGKKIQNRPISANSRNSRNGGPLLFQSRPQSAAERSAASTDDLHKKQAEIKHHLMDIFDRLSQRVEELWRKLKIPVADRKFYRQSLLKGPPKSIDHCKEISAYICMLKAHYINTMTVLEAIMAREVAVTKCYDVLAAVQRKLTRIGAVAAGGAGGPGGGAGGLPQPVSAQLPPGGSTRFGDTGGGFGSINGLGGTSGASTFWKEEVINSLDEVRCATLAVVRCVQAWRRNMWRPQPFIWCGINYVSKMKEDLSLLESEAYAHIFELLPLAYEDLLCVTFFKPATLVMRSSSNSNAASGEHTPARGQSPSMAARKARAGLSGFEAGSGRDGVMHTPQSLAQQQPTPQQAGPTPASESGGGGNGGGGADEYINSLLLEFLTKIDRRELTAAATVVVEEDYLQNALAIEHASLVSKGVFIPTLKLHPASGGGGGAAAGAASAAAAQQMLAALGSIQQQHQQQQAQQQLGQRGQGPGQPLQSQLQQQYQQQHSKSSSTPGGHNSQYSADFAETM